MRIAVEKRIVHYGIPFVLGGPIEQERDRIIPFTIKRGEKEYQDAQHRPAYRKLDVRIGITPENIFYPVHGTGEIPCHQPAEDSQRYGMRNAFQRKRIV